MKIVMAVLFVTALLYSHVSSAELIEVPWEANSNINNTMLTLDTSSGLEWLDLSYTDGISWEQVNKLIVDGALKGFRLATFHELMSFFKQAGITKSGFNPDDVGEWGNMRLLIDLIGSTEGSGVVIGRYDDPKLAGLNIHNRWRLRALSTKGYTSSFQYGKLSDKAKWAYSTGSFLVR
ncbi:MAG: hypothetical protein DIZ80_03395 [endosymbiont of Galathealinum brachiosum]|uniref:Uncharacterized protein n=1 Tax=endosymbiont of Galathealinum brachiosum TaxID=2200906 RepID=A0A370DI20_9GAMM|nr:MAG: hypothetical protein DIZ80_03395 [endosymbiont of Galathealinum brachiosum]